MNLKTDFRFGDRFLLGLILLATAFLYRNVVHFDFVWDDVILIQNNPLLAKPIHLFEIFSSSFLRPSAEHKVLPYYRPLLTLFYMIEYRMFGLFPGGYHLVNVLLHLLNIILVWKLASKLELSKWGRVLATFLFALHPVQIHTLCFISSQGDLLALSFSLISIYFWLQENKTRWMSYTAILLAMLTKEAAVILPAILFLLDRIVIKKPLRDFRKWSLVLVWLLYFSLRYLGLRGTTTEWVSHGPFWATIGSYTTFAYIGRILLPLPAHPLIALPELNPYQILLFHFIFLMFLCIVFVKTKTKPVLFFLTSWFFLTTMLIVDWTNVLIRFSDQLLYFSMVPAGLITGFLIKKTKQVCLLIIAVTVFLGFTSSSQINIWKSDVTLYEDGFKRYPTNSVKSMAYAIALINSGDKVSGCQMVDYTYRLAQKTENIPLIATGLFYNLGNCSLTQNLEVAETYYKKSIEADDNNFKSRKNLVLCLIMENKKSEALEQAQILVQKSPNQQSYLVLSEALRANGQMIESRQARDKANTLNQGM